MHTHAHKKHRKKHTAFLFSFVAFFVAFVLFSGFCSSQHCGMAWRPSHALCSCQTPAAWVTWCVQQLDVVGDSFATFTSWKHSRNVTKDTKSQRAAWRCLFLGNGCLAANKHAVLLVKSQDIQTFEKHQATCKPR